MVSILAETLSPGQQFCYAGRWYARAQEDELARHPVGMSDQVAAYSLGDNRNRVPVAVAPGISVFVKENT